MKLNTKYQIEKATSQDETRPSLTYVHISEDKKSLVATTGRILAIVPVELDETDDRGSATIPPNVIQAARKLAKRDAKSDIGLNDSFQLLNGTTMARPNSSEAGNYPRYDMLISKDPEIKHTVTFNPQLLLDLAKALGSPELVTLEIQDTIGEKAIIVRNNEAYGLIMPMKKEK